MAQRGRPLKVAPSEQIARAMAVFWSKGYLDTTIEDLVEGAGANRFSLYASHGGKPGLYLKALERYRAEIMARFLGPLAGEQASLLELHQFFAQFCSALDDPRSRLGCLICAAGIEVAPLEPQVAERVAGYVAELGALFGRVLTRADEQGELAADADPQALADHFVGAVIGMMTLARSPVPRPLVKNYVYGVLRLIASFARTPLPAPLEPQTGCCRWPASEPAIPPPPRHRSPGEPR